VKETLVVSQLAMERKQQLVKGTSVIQQWRAVSFASFTEAKLGQKASLFKPDADFVTFTSVMNCFIFLLF
jgi:hypothetical protein